MLHSSAATRFAQTIQEHRQHKRPSQTTPDDPSYLVRRFPGAETPWLNGRVPNGYWDVRDNRLHYLNWLGRQYGFTRPSDWYKARKSHFQKNGGGGLLRNEYRSSVLRAMHDYLPRYDWKAWLFGGAPKGFWKCAKNRALYLNWLAEELDIQGTNDWYNVTGADFFAHHGGGLLNNEYKGSVQALLQDYMPDHQWTAWRFPSVPQCFWNEIENRRSYLRWLGEQLAFESREDWNQLRREHFYNNHGSGVFVGYYNGSTEQAIQELFACELQQPTGDVTEDRIQLSDLSEASPSSRSIPLTGFNSEQLHCEFV